MEKVTFLNPEFFWLFLLLPGLIFWVIQKRKVQTATLKMSSLEGFKASKSLLLDDVLLFSSFVKLSLKLKNSNFPSTNQYEDK